MYPDVGQKLTYETKDSVYFFTNAFYPFDNFSAHTVEIWAQVFYTAEHAFQWKKFESTDATLARQIKLAGSPWLVKKLSQTSKKLRSDWADIKVGIMTEIFRAKAAQHDDVQQMLISTGTKTIVENSPVDSFWGCGKDGKGENKMGKILMKIRDELNNTVASG